MAQRVAAIFPDRSDAERAADAMVDLGADRDQISILSRGEERAARSTGASAAHDDRLVEPARQVGDSGAALTTTDARDVEQGAVVGALAGLAAGLLALTIPGVGLVLAAGPLALAAAGGALAGGVYGGLRDIGISEPHARGYEERLRGGGVLMTAVIPEWDERRVQDALEEHGAEDVSFHADLASAGITRPRSVDQETSPPATEEIVDTPVMSAPSAAAAAGDEREGEAAPASASTEVPVVVEEVVIQTWSETEGADQDVQPRRDRTAAEEEGDVEADEPARSGASRSA